MADQCTKFEVSNVSRCGDILQGAKFYNGHLTLTSPLSENVFFIGRLGLAMIDLCTKFKVSACSTYEDMNGGAK